MKAKVAVEADLTNVSDYLEEQGYQVIEFMHSEEIAEDLQEVDAIITSGMHENLLGMEDIETEALMIEANGLTPEEISDMLEQQL
jgi:galactitol-specific phosphotransferase system IIB component